ncbi:MAG: 3-hydroxybutyrate dehydrogenase [Dongiaceae bacterium]
MLKNKTALITGSTSGIGLGIAEAMAAEGAKVVLNGFGDKAEIENLRKKLKAEYHPADMTKPDEIADMMRQYKIDILVNNAGIQHVAAIDEFPPGKWDEIIAINLSAAFHTTRLALPQMKKNKWGRIINIASAHGLVASPFKSAYVAAKHGLVGMTKSAALEVAETGITINAICPGYVKTPLVENQIAPTAKARGMSEDEVVRDVILAAQPTKQFIGVDEVAAFALFLCGDQAANITGAALSIDGGWTAR